MKKQHYPSENGEMTINGQKMSWTMKRSRNASAFGIRGSRIFWLELKKNGNVIGLYDRGWAIGKRIDREDEEGTLCLSYLVDRYGKELPRKKKEMGFDD